MADEAGVPDACSANGFPARSFPCSHHGVPEGEMRAGPVTRDYPRSATLIYLHQ